MVRDAPMQTSRGGAKAALYVKSMSGFTSPAYNRRIKLKYSNAILLLSPGLSASCCHVLLTPFPSVMWADVFQV